MSLAVSPRPYAGQVIRMLLASRRRGDDPGRRSHPPGHGSQDGSGRRGR
jgi:hypothetical protein